MRSARDKLLVHAERSQNEWTFRIVGDLGADVLDAPLPFRSEKVEAEAVLFGISLQQETRPKHHPLRRVHEALEDRVLHALAMILA